MKKGVIKFLLLCLIVFGAITHRVCAAEIKTKVIDGLGRPLSNATIEVELTAKAADGKIIQVQRLKLSSDRDGLIIGSYDDKNISTNDLRVEVDINKAGYAGYSTGLRDKYVLKRCFGPKDVRRIARLTGEQQKTELRELLSGDFGYKKHESLQELVFLYYRSLGPALRSLLTDPELGSSVAGVLSFIGVPEDIRLVIKYAPRSKRELFENRWAYDVVCALLEPVTEEEWAFLRNCAIGKYDDGWVDFGAIVILKLIASPRSLEILQEVEKKNPIRKKTAALAVKYIETKPPSLSSTNLIEAGNTVAQAIKIGDWEGNKEPRFNDEGDMALIDCEFISGRDCLTYTATFHQIGDMWKLRGVRETMQCLMAEPPDQEDFIGVWHGYCTDRLAFGRLDLKKDGTGLLVISYLRSSPPSTYRVTKWSQRRFQLDVAIKPAEPEAEAITLKKVRYSWNALQIELHGSDWDREMTLFNETEFQGRADAVKKSMEGMLKPKQKE